MKISRFTVVAFASVPIDGHLASSTRYNLLHKNTQKDMVPYRKKKAVTWQWYILRDSIVPYTIRHFFEDRNFCGFREFSVLHKICFTEI